MFVDEVKIRARAGHGGRGCVAFLREACRPKGGPIGGNGGAGGHVILEANHDLNNLIAQYYQPHLSAEDGKHGLGKGMDGHAGKDLVVRVPCGTLVWRLPHQPAQPQSPPDATPAAAPGERPLLPVSASQRPLPFHGASGQAIEVDLSTANDPTFCPPQPLERGELIADLVQHGQQFVLCRGGRGGLGNRNFATARRQAPRFAQPGEPGESGEFRLELRLIADVGLVGCPNAGKSTLLSAISKARPKIASYPFTTLTPKIGIVEYPDWGRLTVCDIPGLIEGAHRNLGLGHAFLRHIQRCKIIVLVLDMAGMDGRKPWDDHRQLLDELAWHDPDLLGRPRLVVANKMDEPAAVVNLRSFKRRIPRTEILPMAAAFDQGIDEFKNRIRAAVQAL